MNFKLTAQAGLWRTECGLSAEHSGNAQPQRPQRLGRRHYFGWVLKAADITSAPARFSPMWFAQPILTTLPDSTDKRMSVMDWRIPVGATSRSGDGMDYCPRQPEMAPHYHRHLGNPRVEKVRPHRLRQNMASEPDACAGVGSPRQGTLTITGSNVHRGTEMPVALSLF